MEVWITDLAWNLVMKLMIMKAFIIIQHRIQTDRKFTDRMIKPYICGDETLMHGIMGQDEKSRL